MTEFNSLAGQLLIAMPQMEDHRFVRSVVFLCAHNAEGAMGLVLNKLIGSLTLPELLEKLGIPSDGMIGTPRVHFGGPVEAARGFVLHSADYREPGSLDVGENLALTATLDILRAIGRGDGPQKSLLALGYAGWGPGQLEQELARHGWFATPGDENLLYDHDVDTRWAAAFQAAGIDSRLLAAEYGTA
jgi:putative transcriptional regulator